MAGILSGLLGGGGLLGKSGLSDPDTRLMMGAAMMSGNTLGEQLGNGFGVLGQQRMAMNKRNKTLEWMRSVDPEMAAAVESGALDPNEAANSLFKAQLEARKPKMPDYMEVGGQLFNPDTNQWIAPPQNPNDEFAKRQAAAQSLGITPDNPAYNAYVLTGKMPREDQAPLTATDKQAILTADEMVAANENAITAIEQAEKLSEKANSGWLAGTRAAIGNNLPDLMVPDAISSPESSLATTDMDNAIVGQALSSLKTIFGGNPTEGERKILLDLQGSSSMPASVRKNILARAKEMAMRRLEFNRQRAAELRGGSYYRQGGGAQMPQQAPQSGGLRRTSSGIGYTAEP